MRFLRSFITVLLVLVAASFLAPPGRADAAPVFGQQAPGFKVVSTSGQTITQDNYHGYVLILDFFATWCSPCRQTIPHLVEMNRKYRKQGLQILGMNVDANDDQAVKVFANEFHINYPLAVAGNSATVDFGVRSVPVMYLIDRKGNVAGVFRGYYDEMSREMEQIIKRLLAEK